MLKSGIKKRDPFLDIRDLVNFGGEQGLLSIAFHPDYLTNRRFYVYYVDNGGDIVVDEFKRCKDSPLRAKAKTRRRVIKVEHDQAAEPQRRHRAVQPRRRRRHALAGDRRRRPAAGPARTTPRTPDSLLGKLLRIDPIPDGGGPGYDVPADNPFVGVAGADEIWSLGFRNPFRFSFDLSSGDLALGDVGGSDWEELDYDHPSRREGRQLRLE